MKYEFPKWKDMLGIPYVLGGTGKDGIDCKGLVFEIYRRAGFDFTILKDCPEGYLWVDIGPPIEPLDIIFVGGEGHIVIAMCENWILECSRHFGVRQVKFDTMKYQAYRFARLTKCSM